ncbi:MAG TPA: energy transducer TonB [Burkholderiales bacterium]|nr:energy transducer TonB [Burkholderiales bacterium]
MSAASAALFEERVDPGKVSSALLAAAVHLALLAVLIFGVRWQNRPPEAVSVELWEPPPPAPVVEAPAPKVEPLPAPEVKPEPALEKPDIAVKAPPPKPVAKPAPKAEPKAPPKSEAVKPKADEARKRMRQELAREQESLAIDREREQIRDQLAHEVNAGNARALATWIGKVHDKIRNNIVLPPDIQGNPEAVFLVVQLPTGEVLPPRLVKSSGHKGYDDAVERAILKSSPLPKPDRPELFERELKLTFRPKD